MFLIVLCLLITAPLSSIDYYSLGQSLANEQQKKASAESKEKKTELKKELSSLKPIREISAHEDIIKGKCAVSKNLREDPQTSLYVFVSFSMPDETWLMLSKEIEKTDGVLVLRGLPKNSFEHLAVKMHALRKQGMQATVQIDPRLFNKFGIENVPSFVTIDKNDFDKLSGNISLSFALSKMETESAKSLRKSL